MSRLVRWRSFVLPASIGLLLIVAGGWYNLTWLPAQHKYLDDRNFRLLKTLSEQIRSSIDTFDKMMDNASDSGVTEEMLDSYLQNVAPQLRKVEPSEERELIRGDYGDPPKMAVRADEGTHFLYLAFWRASNATKYAVQTDLDKMIARLLPPAERSPFDVVLVAQSDGTVIFQKSSQGLDVARIDLLENAAGVGKGGKPDPIDVKSLSSSSKFSEINLAGKHYRLYSQPVQLSLPLIDPARKVKENSVLSASEHWILCGLVREDAFRSESQSISYTYFLWFSAAILLMVATYPFLRLFVSSGTERLRPADVVVAAVSTCLAAATLTFILLDSYYWRNDFVLPTVKQMRDLAAAIDENFGVEKEAALGQLDEFSNGGYLAGALHDGQHSGRRPQFGSRDGECSPPSACRTEIAKPGDAGERLSKYPYLELASWSDDKGDQKVKWTIRRHVTPFIDLDDPSIPYYPAVKSALRNPTPGKPVPTWGIGSQYSSNTGDYITVFWKLIHLHRDGKAVPGKADPNDAHSATFCASLVSRPISVVDPVLPGGFKFAIIKPDGTVVFHSDSTRNLRENFFAETDEQEEVRSRALMRAEGWLVANYMGRGHRLYLRPMVSNKDELWTVVVFRDLRLEETINLEILSLASLMFLFYVVMSALAVALVRWIRGVRVGRGWLWPDARKAAKYHRFIVINGIAAPALLLLSLRLPTVLSLVCTVLVAVATLTYNVLVLRSAADESTSLIAVDKIQSSGWQFGYIGALSMLVVVIAVLPCLPFYRVACDFEHKFLVERSQLQIAADVDHRAQGVRYRYQSVNLGAQMNRVFADPEESSEGADLHQRSHPYFWYWQGLPGTRIVSAPHTSLAPVLCGLRSAKGLERCLELLFGRISPLYNQFSADIRYLTEVSSETLSGTSAIPSTETTSRVWTWSSIPTAQGENLTLVRQEPGERAWSITTLWSPFHVPWGNGGWRVGTLVFLAGLVGLIRLAVRRIFLLDTVWKCKTAVPALVSDPARLLADLPTNLLVIGRDSSPTIVDLIARQDVQKYDIREVLDPPMQRAQTVGGRTVVASPAADPVDVIVKDGRKVLFYNFESGLASSDSEQLQLSILERVLSKVGHSVIVISKVDPLTKLSEGRLEPWQMLLRSFVRIDLNSSPAPYAVRSKTIREFESEISIKAYCQSLFSDRPISQKLVLVQLAQEKLVSPNSGPVVCQLFSEGLVECSNGLIAIKDPHFTHFLKSVIPPRTIRKWERQGAGVHSGTLRVSLLVLGLAAAGFLLYTQGAVFNTWVTYATGLAASIPALFKVFEAIRQGGFEPQARS